MCNQISCQTSHERLVERTVRNEGNPFVSVFCTSGLLCNHGRIYETFHSYAQVQDIAHGVCPLYERSNRVFVIVCFPCDDSSLSHCILNSFTQRKKLAYMSYKRMAEEGFADNPPFLLRCSLVGVRLCQ